MSREFEFGQERWERNYVYVNLGSSTVTRIIVNEEEDPEFKSRPVGFTANLDDDTLDNYVRDE